MFGIKIALTYSRLMINVKLRCLIIWNVKLWEYVKLDKFNGGVKKLCNMITRFFGLWIFCKGHGHIIISKGTLMVMKVECIVEKRKGREKPLTLKMFVI